jgi:heat shock protein HslJ
MSPARSTRMAGPQEAMALEQSMLDAMQQADGAQIEGERLCLLRGSVVLVRFVRPRL